MFIGHAVSFEIHDLLTQLLSGTSKPVSAPSRWLLLHRIERPKTLETDAARRLLFLLLNDCQIKAFSPREPAPVLALTALRFAPCSGDWCGSAGEVCSAPKRSLLGLHFDSCRLQVGLWGLTYRERLSRKMIDIGLMALRHSPAPYPDDSRLPPRHFVTLANAFRLTYTRDGQPLGLTQELYHVFSMRLFGAPCSWAYRSFLPVKRPAPPQP